MPTPPAGCSRLKRTSQSFPVHGKLATVLASIKPMTGRNSSSLPPTHSENLPPLRRPEMEVHAPDGIAGTSPGASTAAGGTAGRPADSPAGRGSMAGTVTETVTITIRTIEAGQCRLLPFKATSKLAHTMSVMGQEPTLSIRVSAVND
jgi:hypothetical protein